MRRTPQRSTISVYTLTLASAALLCFVAPVDVTAATDKTAAPDEGTRSRALTPAPGMELKLSSDAELESLGTAPLMLNGPGTPPVKAPTYRLRSGRVEVQIEAEAT